jgi:hypothetical protein
VNSALNIRRLGGYPTNTHPTRPKIPSGLGRVLPNKPNPTRDRVGLGFENKTHLAGWVISGWVVGSGWVVRTLSLYKKEDAPEAERNSINWIA